MASAVIFVFPSEGATADAECLRCISANGSPIKPRCRWVAMEVRGKMKQEQEPKRLGGCCQQSLKTHLYGESFFFLAFFWCSQPHTGHAGLSEGVEFSLPPQGALQSTSLFPEHSTLSCPIPAPCPRPPSGPLCLLAMPSWGRVPVCPQSSPGHRTTLLGQKQSWPQGHPCSGTRGTSHVVPPARFTPGLGGSLGWHRGQGWGTAGQAAVRGRCITLGDLEQGEAMPFPAYTARVSQGCMFTRWQALREAPERQELGPVATGRASTTAHCNRLALVQ